MSAVPIMDESSVDVGVAWHYGDPIAEYWAVREGVSLGDVSTLGKMIVSGPDVVEALEHLQPPTEDLPPPLKHP